MKELEDLACFPSFLRNFQTEFIGFVVTRFNIYKNIINHINSLSLSPQTMTDLCSGSGEPAIQIYKQSNCFIRLNLSDKYPNPIFSNGKSIFYSPGSEDVLEMKFQQGTCYTMLNALHHFNDENKVEIAQKILKSKSSFFFAEILEPNIICLLKVFFIATAGNILFAPFVKPFSLKRILFTYLIPVNVLSVTYDGIVSVLKSRSANSYRKLFSGYGNQLHVFRLTNGLTPLILIQGGEA